MEPTNSPVDPFIRGRVTRGREIPAATHIGFLDSCAVGDVFAGPSLDDVAEALRVTDHSAGVLALIGNYGGDRMVFELVAEELDANGTPTVPRKRKSPSGSSPRSG